MIRRVVVVAVLAAACSSNSNDQILGGSTAVDAGFAPDAAAQDAGLLPPSDAGVAPAYVFDPRRKIPTDVAIGPCMDAHLSDLDGDGDLDVVLAMEGATNRLLENDGLGAFRDRTGEPFTARAEDSEDVVAFDANGDPWPDLLFVSEDLGGRNELYLSRGPFDYVAATSLPGTGTTNGLAVGDLNGDDAVDAVLGNAGPNFIWFGDGAGGFQAADPATYPVSGLTAQDVELGDIDGDGDLDIVIANDNGSNRLWRNLGDGRFEDATDELLPGGPSRITREADFADVDGDGDLDLFFANVRFVPTANPNNRLLLNDGSGKFSWAPDDWLPADELSTLDGDFVDLDGDGDLDLVTANSRVTTMLAPGPYRVYTNDGAGRFRDATDDWFPGAYEGFGLDVEVGDLDGDGYPDIYLCGRSSSDRVLFGGAVPAGG